MSGNGNGSKVGRPTKFRAEFADHVLTLRPGATTVDIAEALGVNPDTVYVWLKKHPVFAEAVKRAKALADEQVERSLYERATGYTHPEDKIFLHKGEPVVVSTIKHYPPDPVAMIFWLKNRKSREWRDKIQHEVTQEPIQFIMHLGDGKTEVFEGPPVEPSQLEGDVDVVDVEPEDAGE